MGLGIVAVGIGIGVEAALIKVAPIYAKVGPAAFLWLAAALLAVCGATVAWFSSSTVDEEKSELSGPFTILAGLAAAIFLFEPLGFIPAATLLFILTARGLGSRRIVRDIMIGLAVCVAAYLVFAKGLGLRLPMGALFT